MTSIFPRWLFVLSLLILSCSDNNDPAPKPAHENLVTATSRGSWTATNLQLLVQLLGRDIDVSLLAYDVDVYQVTYKTSYKDEEINASGLVIMPKSTDVMPMISFHRGTTVEQAHAPSVQERESEQVLSYSALASMGFITVVPDLIGFAESQEIFHPYYIEQATANAVRDMLLAAKELADDKDLNFNERLFLAGYSQGGYVTMAAHKSLEADPLEGFDVVASFPGAGGYDLNEMLGHVRQASVYPDPYYLAYIGMGFQTYYGQDDLLTSFFQEPYASKIPGLFDGINSGSDINNQLTDEIPALIQEDVLSDSESPVNQFLEEKFEENSPVDWTPVAPIFMYHGDADQVVPVQNSEATFERLLDNGADPDNLELIIFSGHNHGSAVEPYIEDIVKKLQALR